MPRKKSLFRCPICNESGQLKEKILHDVISLPKRVISIKDKDEIYRSDLITTLSGAWNYAAKMVFLMQENKIKYPPSSKEEDDLLANSFYVTFSPFIPHTEEGLRNFEEKHIKDVQIVERIKKSEIENLKKDIKSFEDKKRNAEYYPVNSPATKRIRAMTDSNKHASRFSVACLYGSILFATYSKLAEKSLLPPVPPHPKLPQDLETLLYLHRDERENVYAASICQFFSQLTYFVDARNRINPLLWMDIFKVKAEHGYRAASSFTKRFSIIYLCKNCSDLKLHRYVYMKEFQNNKTGKDVTHYCNICRENETIQISVPISVNSIKKREYEVKLDQIYLEAHYYYLTEYMDYMRKIKTAFPKFIQMIKKEFCIQEVEATKSSFLRDRYWYMLHYDKAKRGKRSHYLATGLPVETENEKVSSSRYGNPIRKPHSIMEVKIIDQKYKNLVGQLASAHSKLDIEHEKELYYIATGRLQEIGWPQSIIDQRVRNDIRMVLNGLEPP